MRWIKIMLIALAMALMTACSTIRYVPVEAKTDSIYVEKIIERLDTILVEIPVEVKNNATLADSSHLETSVAISDAWVDSLSILHHTLQNKAENALKKEVPRKDKVIEKTVYKEVPVIQEVEVPVKYVPDYYKKVSIAFWVLLVTFLLYFGGKIYKFIRGGWLGRR